MKRVILSFVFAVLCVAVFSPVASAKEIKTFNAVSPDGLNEVRLELSESKGLQYSVLRRGKILVEPTELALRVGLSWLNGREVYLLGKKVESETCKVEGTIATPIYKKSSIDLAANEVKVDFGDWAVRLHARNDGVAWRFETEFNAPGTPPVMLVTAENTTVRFPKETVLCYTQEGGFMSGWEKPAKIGPVSSVSAGHPQIVMTPFTATVPNAGVVTVTESNLLDYPGLNFYRDEKDEDVLRSWQAGVPDELNGGRRKIKVKSRKPYLAKTVPARTFPWRVFALADNPSGLVSSDIVYALAEPSRIGDASWVKPGLVQWDWWHGFKITDIPGLKTGCNFETYKAYVDFAAENGIEYIIMDEGWADRLDPEKPRAEVNVPGVVEYAKKKGVDVILWAAWAPLDNRDVRLRVFDWCVAIGAKGFKVDFMERDDQLLEKFLEETAADAAERKLVIMYHGIHKPTGLQRTFPNILNYEGVYGLEQGHSIGGRKVVISNDVNLVYTRMVAGFMDYTPGAMRNRAFNAPAFAKGKDPSACYGTRAHQLALFPLFEAPVQMLCDSPTQYRTAPECVKFMVNVPTVWDETVGVAGEIDKFAVVARRKGADWWLGAITNWEAREIEIPTLFLGSGEWKVEAFEDAPDADKNAEHYVRREFTIKAGDKIKVRLAPGGGFAANLHLLLSAPCLFGAPSGNVNDLIGFDSDYAAALKRAKESSRDVFILFTGSDWCRWCRIFESEVLSQKEFLDYATNEWELVVADFPKNKKLPLELRKQNSELRKKYNIRGFPTIVLTDAEGKKLCAGGYSKGGAEAWLKNFIKEKEIAPLAKKYLSPIEKKINDLDEKVVKELFDTTSINENDLKAIFQHRKNVSVKYLPEVKALIKELESIQVPSVLSGKKAGMMKNLKFVNTELQRTVDTQ